MNFTSGFQSDILHIQFSSQAEKKNVKNKYWRNTEKKAERFSKLNTFSFVDPILADWCILGTLKYCFIKVG